MNPLAGIIKSDATFKLNTTFFYHVFLGKDNKNVLPIEEISKSYFLLNGNLIRISYPLYKNNNKTTSIDVFITKDAKNLEEIINVEKNLMLR